MNVAIFLFDGVEILDFGGPAEVFAATGSSDEEGIWKSAFNVYTVASGSGLITSQGFLKVKPDFEIGNEPPPGIVVIPGGSTKKIRKDPKVIQWLQKKPINGTVILSVCTGAFLLGDAGLLRNKEATTWHGQIDLMTKEFPDTEVHENVRFVDNGSIITTAGVSAGIDGALHLVARLLGHETAALTAKYMEYDRWDPSAGLTVQ